jgi:hypothetical protein
MRANRDLRQERIDKEGLPAQELGAGTHLEQARLIQHPHQREAEGSAGRNRQGKEGDREGDSLIHQRQSPPQEQHLLSHHQHHDQLQSNLQKL